MSFIPRLLIVDDAEAARDAFALMLPRDRYLCDRSPSAADSLKKMGQWTYDVVIADMSAGGLALLDRLKHERPSLPVILVTAMGTVQEGVDAIRRGAFHYLIKPCNEVDLQAAIDGAIAARRRAPASPADGFGLLPAREAAPPKVHENMELVGSGPAMRELLSSIELVATSSAPVLVTGESGSGKELVARAIHAASPRAGRAFVAVNTSAIPEDLLEGEIFGHVRGGFTGATQARKGLLTEASGGTLLLDEIGDMPLGLQAKLLRVLQFGEVRPVGSDQSHPVDVRIIAATHRDLQELVRERRFREDLFFRLDVLPLVVAPLRERREDIPMLVEHFLARARQRAPHSPVQSIEPCAREVLMAASWPGNVRELASVIERIVVFGRDEKIVARDLSFLSPGAPPRTLPPVAASPGEQPRTLPPVAASPGEQPWTLRRVAEAYMEQVLAQTGGNKQRAAEILDVDPSTLYRWHRSQKAGVELMKDPDRRADATPRARQRRGSAKRGSMLLPQ